MAPVTKLCNCAQCTLPVLGAITHALQQCCTCRGARYARLDSSGSAQNDTTTIRHAMDVLGDLQHPR